MINKFKQWLNLEYAGKEKTITTYSQQISQFLNFSNNNISQELIDNYLKMKLERKCAKTTYNLILNSFKIYFKFINQDFKLPKNQTGIKPKIKEGMTWEEIVKNILPYTSLIFQDYKRVDLLLKFMYFTGLRREEVAMLKSEDINWKEEYIHLKHTKGDKERIVPLIRKDLTIELKEWIANHPNKTIFNITSKNIKNKFDAIKEQCQLKKFHPHLMRSYFANYVTEEGIDIRDLKEAMGHADLKTTERYITYNKKRTIDAFRRIKK